MAFNQSRKLYIQIEKKNGTYDKTRQMLQKIYNEKYKKLITPLTIPPPKRWEDVSHESLLYKRCVYLKTLCNKLLKIPFSLYLFGSQISGLSSSGYPDIDILCKTNFNSTELKLEILNSCDFKLDFNFITNEPLFGMLIY